MNILFVIPGLRTGGAEKMLVELIPQMKREGVNCSLLLFDRKKTHFSTLLEKEDIEIRYTFRQSFFNLLNLITFFNVIFSSKYDVIHCHLTYSQFWIALVSIFNIRKKKLITTEHSSNNRRRGKRLLNFVDKFVYSRFRWVISVSGAVQESLIGWIEPRNTSKYIVIENCVDIKKFSKAQPALRCEFGLSEKDIVLTMVGRMTDAKDQACIIKALSLLGDDYKAILVGDGETIGTNRLLAEKLGIGHRVCFTGERNDIAHILQMSDIYIQASHWEGLPTAPLEAMAAGKPTLGADVPGVRDVLSSRMMYRHADAEDLANLILKISAKADFKELLEEQQQILQRFDLTHIVKKHLEIYRK